MGLSGNKLDIYAYIYIRERSLIGTSVAKEICNGKPSNTVNRVNHQINFYLSYDKVHFFLFKVQKITVANWISHLIQKILWFLSVCVV